MNDQWTPERIKALRHRLGETQRKFGERCGVSYRTIQDWEGSLNVPTGASLRLLDLVEKTTIFIHVGEAPQDSARSRKRLKNPEDFDAFLKKIRNLHDDDLDVFLSLIAIELDDRGLKEGVREKVDYYLRCEKSRRTMKKDREEKEASTKTAQDEIRPRSRPRSHPRKA